MAFNDLRQRVRDSTTNKNLAKAVERRYTRLKEWFTSLSSSTPNSPTTQRSQKAIASQLDGVAADLNRMNSDPHGSGTYDIVQHFQTSAELTDINDRMTTIEAQIGPPPISTATDPQQRKARRQGSIPPPRRRDSQTPATAMDDAIAESAAKDNKRFIRRLINLLEEFNTTVQAAERNFNLAHNAEGGTIRMPDISHHRAIYQEVRDLLKGESNIELRRFQEASMQVNHIITEIRDKMNLPRTCKIQLYQLDDPRGPNWVCVLPDDVTTTNELITHLVERNLFEEEGDVRIFLRKGRAHRLTPKGRLWELADGCLNLRLHDAPTMDKVEYEDGALVLDWVVNTQHFAIALIDNGEEEMGSVLELPRQNRRTNERVRDYLRARLLQGLTGYEIERISDISTPNDLMVAEKDFHQNNFRTAKHSLVVKLRARI